MLAKFPQYDYELIIIDNCSKDNTVVALRELAAADERLKVIVNARNFGPTRSILFAQRYASGDCLITLASDLEDPPELIEDFLLKWQEGYKAVVAVKKGSKEKLIIRNVRKLYYKLIDAISEVEQIRHFTGFGLYDASIIDALKDSYDVNTYFRGLISEYGYDIARVEFVRPVREHGRSSYNFFSYFDYALTGITSNAQVSVNQAELNSLLSSINRVVGTTSYAGTQLLNGAQSFTYNTNDANSLLDTAATKITSVGGASNGNVNIDFAGAATPAQAASVSGDLSGLLAADGTLAADLSVDINGQALTIAAGTSAEGVAAAINGDAAIAASGVSAYAVRDEATGEVTGVRLDL